MVSRTAKKPGLVDDSYLSRLSSSQRLSKLEAEKLEMQWKKICDHEKRSKERNKELLKDFERVEKHAAMLAVKSERLKSYKQQYETYINKMYPRWREELENFRLSQQQSKNGPFRSPSGAPALSPLSSSRADVPYFTANSHFSSTPAVAPNPLASNRSASLTYNRSPPDTYHPSDNPRSSGLQYPYREVSYRERPFDSSRLREGSVLHSRYPGQADESWQSTSVYDYHRPFDDRTYQSHFAPSSGEPYVAYQRVPDRYLSSPGQEFYDGRSPTDEGPRRFPPDTRYGPPEVAHGHWRGSGVATPYEPRTELQRGYHGHGGERGPFYQSGHRGHYNNGWQAGYHGDQRSSEFEPQIMKSNIGGGDEALFDQKLVSGFPTRPAMTSGHDNVQDVKKLPPANEPISSPEKPLERNSPVSSFPEPSFSSTLMETSSEGSDVRHEKAPEETFVTHTEQTQSAAKGEVKEKEENSAKSVVKGQGLVKERAEVLAKNRELDAKSDEPGRTTVSRTGMQGVISKEALKKTSDDESNVVTAKAPKAEKHVPLILDANESEQAVQSDEDESLDLTDLSLPDGNEGYVPSALHKDQTLDQGEDSKGRKNPVVSTGPTKPNVLSETTKSFTEEISEEIAISAPLDESESHDDLPVRDEGNTVFPKTHTEVNVLKQLNTLDARSDEGGKGDDTNEPVLEDEAGKDVSELLEKDERGRTVQKSEDEKRPSVSVDGFLALLQTVDADVEVSFSPEALYRSPQCSSDLRQEIVRAAEMGRSLQSFDPNTVSMIVLEELPLLLSSAPAGCLIPDRVFSGSVSFRSEKDLRPFVETSLIRLWKALFSHFVNLATNNVMRAKDVGTMFGSLLILQDSRHGKESQLLLSQILEVAVLDTSDRSISPPADDLDPEPRFETEVSNKEDVSIASDGSSSTLGSTPPKAEPIKPSEEGRKPTAEALASYEDDFEDDVPLTESAAYLKMLSSARSEPDDDISDPLGNSGPQKQETEADEDVERELARSISPPVTSPRTKSPSNFKSGKQKPKLSLFDNGASSVNEKADNKDLADSWGGLSVKSVKSDISDSESALSPPLSPDGGLGYIPTAVESQEQQQTGQREEKDNDKSEKSVNDSKAKRKTDFWNNSDTESEVDLQLSTGGFDQDDDDDFDFYG